MDLAFDYVALQQCLVLRATINVDRECDLHEPAPGRDVERVAGHIDTADAGVDHGKAGGRVYSGPSSIGELGGLLDPENRPVSHWNSRIGISCRCRAVGAQVLGVVPTCSHVHMGTVSYSHLNSYPSKSCLFSCSSWRLAADRALAILAQNVVEGFGHEVLEAETMPPGAGVEGQRQLRREIAGDRFATDTARRDRDLSDDRCGCG